MNTNMNTYISEKDLKMCRTAGILCVVIGCFIPYIGILLLALGASMCADHRRMKKEMAFLRQYPTATFTQMAGALRMKHKRVCSDMDTALKQKVLQLVEIDTAGDCLRYLAPPAPQAGSRTVPCPNCGANVTVDAVRGGQCEYCGTHLSGKE